MIFPMLPCARSSIFSILRLLPFVAVIMQVITAYIYLISIGDRSSSMSAIWVVLGAILLPYHVHLFYIITKNVSLMNWNHVALMYEPNGLWQGYNNTFLTVTATTVTTGALAQYVTLFQQC
jgi:cellulose synthase/poly-beta-1,6-N-acetylglucosamine synthase-like glycosyltransferase